MMQRNIAVPVSPRSFFPNLRAAVSAGLTVAALMTASLSAHAQASAPVLDGTPAGASRPAGSTPGDASGTNPNTPLTPPAEGKAPKAKDDKVVQSKDTRKEIKRYKKDNPLEGQDAKLPDKVLYDKALDATKHGRFEVSRLDLQTLLNTYPDSQFQMRAKLAIADSWYKEGGTAALTQAEQEYRDFITFFPNAPEAAEAQMRIGDIYFKEMDKPDRDHSKAVHAEQEYRLMLQQFPDSVRVPEAAQRLREVQESLASAESDVAAFYATHLNWPATIARYQTVADTYPLYSHMDDVLVSLGDAYEAEARFYRTLKLPEAAKARLVSVYEDQAAACYRKVILEHSAAAHVEDAKDRMAALGLPIPTPTAEQAAASLALENSRGQYTLSNRALVFFLHRPDTVTAATKGDPPLEDAKPTYAPAITQSIVANFNAALSPAANTPPAASVTVPVSQAEPAVPASVATQSAPAAAAPLAFQDVPAEGSVAPGSSAISTVPSASAAPSYGGSSVGMEIVQPTAGAPAPTQAPGAAPPAFPGTTPPATQATPQSDPSYGLKLAPAAGSTPLAPVEKPTAAPDAINDINPAAVPAGQTVAPGTKAKSDFDKSDESSSKHKKKKGLSKLNPF